MAITLDQINKITLRYSFLPWVKHYLKDLLPPNWDPTDEELERLAQKFGEALREYDFDQR